MSFLFYEGVYFWASTKLLCCVFFAIAVKEKHRYPGILEDLGLGPLKMYDLDRKKRITPHFNPFPRRSLSINRSGSGSTFHRDASQPLLLSPAIYNSDHWVVLDSKPYSSNESVTTKELIKCNELFDKNGDVARAIHLYVLFYIGPQMVLNMARYSSLVAKHEVVWVGSGLRSSGLSAYFFWVTSFIAILSYPFYYWILVMSQRGPETLKNLRLNAMKVEVKENDDTKASDSAELPSTEPVHLVSVIKGDMIELDDSKDMKDCLSSAYKTTGPISHCIPTHSTGGVLTKRSSFYSSKVMKRSYANLNTVTAII